MRKSLIFLFICASSFGYSQSLHQSIAQQGKPFLKVNVKKTGPYFGLRQGLYLVPEVGVERQWKRIKLSNAIIHAAHTGFNYNFKGKILGYDVGYWVKPHRIGLTYGGNLVYRTDFSRSKIGIVPVVGFKIWLLHAQTGYHFMTRTEGFDANYFFISLRIGLINDRDIDVKRKKKDNFLSLF